MLNILNRNTVLELCLIFLLIFSHSQIFAQTSDSKSPFDESFQNGLTLDLLKELDENGKAKEDEELTTLFRSDTSIKKNKYLLKIIKGQLDLLDERFKILEGEDSEGLDRYGDFIFNSAQSSFMPINIPSMASEYIVDIGDTFDLMLTGLTKSDGELSVLRDGSLLIPNIGKVFVAGKTLGETELAVKEFINSTSIGSIAYLSLSRVRDIQILMMGGVYAPGIYTLSGGSSILAALNVAGGISPEGSYRKVDHRRAGKTINTIDLYDILIHGQNPFKGSLRSGDSIIVHPSSFLVPVSGGVSFEAIYEALPGESASDLISYAGDFSESFAGYESISIKRADLVSQEIIDISLEGLKDFKLKPRDVILVPSFLNHKESIPKVILEGWVERPGTYYITDGETLSQLIKRAGGFRENAYRYGGALFRQDAIENEKMYAQFNYAETVKYIISSIGKPGASSAGAVVMELLKEEIKSQSFTGRVIADFNLAKINTDPSLDVTLRDKDKIVIPPLDKVVYLFGEFRMATNAGYKPSYSLKDYIKQAGGFKESAYSEILIIDPDGQSHVYDHDRWLALSSDIEIYPGSIIYAPRNIGKRGGIEFAASVSPVISSLALSLASLNSIND